MVPPMERMPAVSVTSMVPPPAPQLRSRSVLAAVVPGTS